MSDPREPQLTKCEREPIYGNHCTNGIGPDAYCAWCGKPISEWWVRTPA